MFKFISIVRMVCMCTAALLVASAHAEQSATEFLQDLANKNDSKSSENALLATYKGMCQDKDGNPKKNMSAATQKRCEEMEPKVFAAAGAAGETCDDKKKEYELAKKEFDTACGEANITTEQESTSNIACGYAMARCGCMRKEKTEEQKNAWKCESDADTKPRSRRTAGSGPDASAAKRRMKYCPQLGPGDLKKYEERAEKAADKVKELEDKVPQAQEAAQKALTDGQEKLDSIEQEMIAAQKKHGEELEAAEKEKSETQKRLEQELMAKQQQIGQIDEQIGQMDLSKVDADMKRSETITQVDLNCHATASAVVSKKQAEALELLRAGRLNRGGQKDMMKNVGLSDRASWERLAEKYYQWCLVSKPTKDSKASANKIYDMAIRQAEKTKADLRQRKLALQEEMKKLKDPAGQCGQVIQQADGSNNETEMCRAAREGAMKSMRLEADFQREMMGYQKRMATAQMAAKQAYDAKLAEHARLTQQLADEKTRMNNYEQYLDAAADAGHSSETDQKAYGTAKSKFTAFNGAARSLVAACGPKACSSGPCLQAKNYIENVLVEDTASLLASHTSLDSTDRQPDGSVEEPSTTRTPSNRDSDSNSAEAAE